MQPEYYRLSHDALKISNNFASDESMELITHEKGHVITNIGFLE